MDSNKLTTDSTNEHKFSRYSTPDPNDEVFGNKRGAESIFETTDLNLDQLATDDMTATLEELLECLNLEELRSIGRTMRLPKLSGNVSCYCWL